jgi:hypothetical protein
MQNLTENMKIGGVFVCTTFDGQRLFEKLRGVSEGDSWTLYGSGVHGGERIFQLTKRYAETGFPSDEMGLGYGVDVYQESINKTFREYLVHPEFLKSVMFDYGFTLVRREEAEQIGFERGTDTFDALHNSMLKEARFGGNGRGGAVGEYGMAEKMSREEKEVSFLNRYYIFRKRHMVDAGEVLKQRRKRTQAEGVWMNRAVEDIGEITAPEMVGVSESSPMVVQEDGKEKEDGKKGAVGKFRKVRAMKKVVLGKYSPVSEEEEEMAVNKPDAPLEKEVAVEEVAAKEVAVEKEKKKRVRTTQKKRD